MIEQGGYALGMSYAYYRQHGWGALGAVYMMIPTWALLSSGAIVGCCIGWWTR